MSRMDFPGNESHAFYPVSYAGQSSPEAMRDAHEPRERAIWKAVITQALMDASSRSAKAEAQQEKQRARQWLLHDRKDFPIVCHYAGLDPHYVREQAMQALQRDCQWRAPSVAKAKTRPRGGGAAPGRCGFRQCIVMAHLPMAAR